MFLRGRQALCLMLSLFFPLPPPPYPQLWSVSNLLSEIRETYHKNREKCPFGDVTVIMTMADGVSLGLKFVERRVCLHFVGFY